MTKIEPLMIGADSMGKHPVEWECAAIAKLNEVIEAFNQFIETANDESFRIDKRIDQVTSSQRLTLAATILAGWMSNNKCYLDTVEMDIPDAIKLADTLIKAGGEK